MLRSGSSRNASTKVFLSEDFLSVARVSVRDRARGPKRITDFSGGLRVGEEWPLQLSICSAVQRRVATSVDHRAFARAEPPEETVPRKRGKRVAPSKWKVGS